MPLRIRRAMRCALATLLVLAGLIPTLDAVAPQRRDRHVAVTVLGKDDAPVTTLTAADFVVREDNATREILNVRPGAAPANIVLLVDDSQVTRPLFSFLRDGLKAFIGQMVKGQGGPAVRLMSFGERPTVLQEFTTAAPLLQQAVDRIAPRTGSGAYVLDAVYETARELRAKGLTDVAFVAFVAEGGPEFSTAMHTQAADALKALGASLSAITLHDFNADTSSTGGRERAALLGDVTTQTGGLNKIILGREMVVPGFTAIGTALASRYDLTYGRPEQLIPPSKLAVETRSRALKVLVRRWPAE